MPEEFSLEAMVAEVEKYLELPAGSIKPFFEPHQEHWVFVLKSAAIVETVLKAAILARLSPGPSPWGTFGAAIAGAGHESPLKDHIFRIPLRGDMGATSLADRCDLLSKKDRAFIEELSALRNRYAHSILNHSRSVLEVLSDRKDQKQASAVLKKLRYGTDFQFEHSAVDDIEFGVLMFLATISGQFKPVPRPGTGLLGNFLAQEEPDRLGSAASVGDPDRE